MYRITFSIVHALFFFIVFVLSLHAQTPKTTATLLVAADTSLFELDPDFNMGTQRDLPAGALGPMGEEKRARLLFRVDLFNEIPAGAVIIGARYRVLVTMAPESGRRDSTFALHRVHVSWEEGAQRGDIPGGQPASAGETTWNARNHPDTPWSLPGGLLGADYATEASAETPISRTGEAVFEFNSQGLRDLNAMLTDPDENHGWVLMTQEEDRPKTARRFASREHRTDPPQFEIDYELAPSSAEWLASIQHERETGEVVISAAAREGKIYTLQSSDNLESTEWKNETVPAEIVPGKISFRKLIHEKRRFFRIMEMP